ncbi:hypothetical protein LIA77_07279 [Sarocladium implicatum]|nr:hypothetical protein LIA77_07279 [Sarocladium implicatum]
MTQERVVLDPALHDTRPGHTTKPLFEHLPNTGHPRVTSVCSLSLAGFSFHDPGPALWTLDRLQDAVILPIVSLRLLSFFNLCAYKTFRRATDLRLFSEGY